MKKYKLETRKKIIDDILKIVSIQSFTKSGIKLCQQEVINIAENLGFKTKLVANEKVIVIEPNNANPRKAPELGILTHLDTVPFDASEWKYNPLGELKNGRLYGRGVVDDKSAIILAMYVFYLLEDSVRPTWQIIVGSAEESEWDDMKDYLEEGHKLPKFSITLDGDGVQNGCKGYLDLELEFKRDSNEKRISELYIPNGVVNIIPEKAIAIIDGNNIETKGKAAHSSLPKKGNNALINLSEEIKNNFIINEFSGFFKLMEVISKSSLGTSIGFPPHSIFFEEQFIGYTTVCPTTCLLKDDVLTVNLNIRLCPGTTEDEVYQVIEEISSRFHCECYIDKLELPIYISKDSKEISLLQDAYEYVMFQRTSPSIANGIGYNATIPNCVIFGPRFSIQDDEVDSCHSVNESRTVEDLIKFFRMLLYFCEKYLS